MAIVNIGVLAHVDAGKTSLTERILYETGVIASVGSVDKGTTQTDTLELERARGITIKSAVASFHLDDLNVNLIDTPGHGDFIAEVERSLRVLDGVILVISAVEGVQSQTRRLARAIQAACLPLVIFVNKIDRIGARHTSLLDDIRRKLHLRIVPINTPHGLENRTARVLPIDRDDVAWRGPVTDLLAESSERVIEEFERTGGDVGRAFLEAALREQVAGGEVVPVYFGSAITGVGVRELLTGVAEWLPTAQTHTGTDDAPAAAVFKIVRRPSGEKVVYVRLFSGSLAVRQRIGIYRHDAYGEPERIEERITGIDRFTAGTPHPTDAIDAGEIACLHGLRSARIGDRIGTGSGGTATTRETARAFPPPAMESVVRPNDPAQVHHLRTALEQLAEQDPLISLRQRNEEGEISVRLYGEVQKEVVTETLLRDFGISVGFGPSQTVCVERPTGEGHAEERIFESENPYYATVGIRITPGAPGSGIRYERELGALPLGFYRAIEETIYDTLAQGLHGWEVTDCCVTLTQVGLCPITTAADFRKLTPLVLMNALQMAGTHVCEPIDELELEIPEDTFGTVCGVLMNARATIRSMVPEGEVYHIICGIPSVELRAVEQQLPGLTRGDGGWVSHFAGYVPVSGEPPVRRRYGPNPLNRAHYLAEVARA